MRTSPLTGVRWLVLQRCDAARRNLKGKASAMKNSLRKTPSQLHLGFESGAAPDRLRGRNFTLMQDSGVLTISIDLSANFQTRNKTSPGYLDALNLVHNHQKLRWLQCGDNLVRSRLIRAWEQVRAPRLKMCLELGQRGRFLYSVQPHSLLMGGIQFDVEEVLEEDARATRLQPQLLDTLRSHS
jgi:hypothetical protein